jgi:hypothetical protein
MNIYRVAWIIFLTVVLEQRSGYTQSKYTIDGIIKDAADGESLIGVNVFIRQTGQGVVTNAYGFYSLTLPAGSYTVEYSFIGYNTVTRTILLDKNLKLHIELQEQSSQLEEIEILGENEGRSLSIKSIEMSTNKLDIKTIQKLPALLGEVDIVKSLQFLPGVSQAGEGSSGFNVRGGSTGQNLVLLDEAPVYNSSHMLGFFSVFNPDAVKDVKLYKGAIPASYGGRTSAVLDVRMKEGNNKQVEVNGGVGLIFSRLSVEGPLVKDKSSFIIAARRSYIDVLASPFLDGDLGLNFYDVTLKTNYTLNQKNRLYVSGYLGRDNFSLSDDAIFNWGNKTATVRLNSIISSKLFANFSGVYSNYNYRLGFDQDESNSYDWNSSISNYLFKPDFSYYISETSELNFGLEATYFRFNPSRTVGVTNGETVDNSLELKYALESAVYINHKLKLSPRADVSYGLRLSHFRYLGAGTAYTYNDTIPGKRRSVVSEKEYGSGQTIASYTTPEPRISFKYETDANSSVKASYTRTSQYIHFISNTTASNPLNVWTPSTNNLKPTVSNQFTLGYFRTLGEKSQYEASVETYYRRSENEVDYINGADLLSNRYLEGDLLNGQGRAYGLEVYAQKKTGRLSGWVSYTLSRSELKVNGINRGKWYPARYDQTHNLKVVGILEINKRWSATADFVFTTGTPTTYPNQRYTSQGILIPYNSTNARNDVRISNYHRLDLSLRMEGKTIRRNGKTRRNHDYWVFSVYNIYARKNAFSTYFSQSDDRVAAGQPLQAEAHKVSIIGTMVPSVSYNFKF